MIGYKKCIYFNKKENDYQVRECIVELEIPDDARVVTPLFGNKHRCNKAIVKAIFLFDKERLPDDTIACSIMSIESQLTVMAWSRSMSSLYGSLKSAKDVINYVENNCFTYVVGMTVYPEYGIDPDPKCPCSSGIHFFKSFEEAIEFAGLARIISLIRRLVEEGTEK